ncbi:MAG TPA: M20/M25/M40 family metallo-hydrolase [Elusimicrobiota bacterium]|jgi:endoglucanase|nr:M20/M25/M40 family metallo-hydrolase [Elusimicrobiota bacterium]
MSLRPDAESSRLILRELLSQPTAPFHEHRVRAALIRVLERAGVSTRVDASGNLLARYRRGRAKPVAFTAHMDHPGLELLSVSGTEAEARWNGQVPTFDLRDARVALWSDSSAGLRGEARVLDGDGRRPPETVKRVRLEVPPGARAGDFGYADLTPFALEGGFIVSKCLDNVAGCAAIAAALQRMASLGLPGNVHALFTRAEEVGFHGALAAIAGRAFPKTVPAVVLECSKAMPGAEQGQGPVIRVGDKARVFDADLIAACEEAAREAKKADPELRVQRRLMDGGTCEASAFGLAGWRAMCLAFPLANYHNVGPAGLEPEKIMERDFLDGVALLCAFAAKGLDPAGARRRLAGWVKERFGAAEARRLKSSAGEPGA